MKPHELLADAIEAWLQNEITKGTPPASLGDALGNGVGLGIQRFVAVAAKRGHENDAALSIAKRALKVAIYATPKGTLTEH